MISPTIAGVSPTFMSKLENGTTKPTLKIIMRVTQFTAGVSRDEFCAAAKMLPPDIQVTLEANPALWDKVRRLYT